LRSFLRAVEILLFFIFNFLNKKKTMIILKKINYNGVDYELYTMEIGDGFYFSTKCPGINAVGNVQHISGLWTTSEEAIKDREKSIDDFLAIVPKNYKELANWITDSLVWTGHEDCYADESIVKTLVENFIKFKNQTN